MNQSAVSGEHRIQVEQIKILCQYLPVVILASFLTSIIVAWALRDELPLRFLIIWLAFAALLTAWRLYRVFGWSKRGITADIVQGCVRGLTVDAALSGLLWGTFAFLSVSEAEPLISLFIIMILTGMTASATASLSHFRSVSLSFVLLAMLPPAVRFYTFDDALYFWIALLICIYLAVSFIFSNVIRTAMRKSIELRFENLDLIDELKIENKRTDAARALAEQSNLAKSRFLASASHDLRQPLHALRLFTTTLQMQTRESRFQSTAAHIESAVKALEQLFNALLDISKLDAGTRRAEPEHFHINSLLEKMERDFHSAATAKGLTLNIEQCDHVVHTDPMLLEQLLRNLTSNAIRYTQFGSITISTTSSADKVSVSIVDTGDGIAIEDQESIFEEFVQLSNPERDRSKGIGLGLSIVRRISLLLDTSLSLESTLGHGTRFTLELKTGDAEQVVDTIQSNIIPTPDLSDSIVVFVDDEEAVRTAMVGLLEEWGCTVLAASSGSDALQLLDDYETKPDAVIADFRLREEETGAEVINAIQESWGTDIPGLIVTGDIAPERLKEVEASGFPVLHKPCDPEALREFLNWHCDHQ